MKRLKAYSVFANTKDKRLIGFLYDYKSLLKVGFKDFVFKSLSLEHFLYVLNKLNDFQFLREITEIIRNTLDFHSKYFTEANVGKILIENGYKTDYSLEGRVTLILNKVKNKLENYDRI